MAEQVLQEQALTVERGGLPGRLTANTLGEVDNLLNLGGPIISGRSFINPKLGPQSSAARTRVRDLRSRIGISRVRSGPWTMPTTSGPSPWTPSYNGACEAGNDDCHGRRGEDRASAGRLCSYPAWARRLGCG